MIRLLCNRTFVYTASNCSVRQTSFTDDTMVSVYNLLLISVAKSFKRVRVLFLNLQLISEDNIFRYLKL